MAAQQRKPPAPIDLVVLTRARLQEVVDEAVRRGRITRSDATDLVADAGRPRPQRRRRRPQRPARDGPARGRQPAGDHGLRRPDRGGDRRPARRPRPGAAAHGSAPTSARTRTARPSSRRSSAAWPRYPRSVTTPPTSTRPARGAELELTVDSLAHGGNGVARLDGYVVFVAGALPGDRVRAVVGKSKRAYAEARAVEVLEPSPDRIAPVADHPGAPWQVLAVRPPARGQGRAGRRRPAPDREARRLRAGPDRPRARAVALPQQARVLVRHRPGRDARVRLPRARALGRDRPDGRLPARLRARQRGPRAGARLGARAGPRRLGPAHPAGPAAQPRRARGPADRRAAGPARHARRARSTPTRSPPRSTARGCSGPAPPTSARAPRAARRSGSRAPSGCARSSATSSS